MKIKEREPQIMRLLVLIERMNNNIAFALSINDTEYPSEFSVGQWKELRARFVAELLELLGEIGLRFKPVEEPQEVALAA